MLLRFFRINDPYRLLGLVIIITLLLLPLILYPVGITVQELKLMVLGESLNDGNTLYVGVIDNTPPLAAWFSSWMDLIFGRSQTAAHIIALVLIIFQASFFGILLINNKAYDESTYLPSFIFVLLSIFSFDLLSLSPELLASTILLFALNNLFKEIEFRIQREEIIFGLGVFLGVASLLVFTYAIYLPGALVILIFFTRITIRKTLLLVLGFGFPHLLLLTSYYFWGHLDFLLQHFYLANYLQSSEALVSSSSLIWLALVPLLYFVFSLIMLNREARFTKYQSQLLQVMLLWLIIATVEVFLTKQRTPHSLFTFIPPLAYLISHYLLLIRRRWRAELMLWLLIIGVVSINYLARYQVLNKIDYTKLFPPVSPNKINGKRLLVLGSDAGIYLNNKSGSAFLNWELSKPVFEEPDYVENLVLVASSFDRQAPEVIVDPDDYMSPFFKRMPQWERKYSRKGIYWIRISN